MLVDKETRAEQAALLAVSEHGDHVALERGAGLQGAERFEHDGHTGRVVGSPRAFLDRVVMRAEREGFPARGPLPFDSSQHVLRHRRFLVIRCLNFGRQPDLLKVTHERLAHSL